MYGFDGPKGTAFHHFNFHDADDLFSRFFNAHEFDDDPFFSSFFGNKSSKGNKGGFGGGFGGFGGFSMFGDNDPFFKDMGMGGFGQGASSFTSFSSSSSTGGPKVGGVSKSVSTTTKTVYLISDVVTVRRW